MEVVLGYYESSKEESELEATLDEEESGLEAVMGYHERSKERSGLEVMREREVTRL